MAAPRTSRRRGRRASTFTWLSRSSRPPCPACSTAALVTATLVALRARRWARGHKPCLWPARQQERGGRIGGGGERCRSRGGLPAQEKDAQHETPENRAEDRRDVQREQAVERSAETWPEQT